MRYHFLTQQALRQVRHVAVALVMIGCRSSILGVDTPDVLSSTALGGSLGATTI